MIRNNKYFYPPPEEEFDFKELFKLIASAGAGRPVDEDGFSSGPWTPELLTDAISSIDANRDGIELRTVQLWFQDNDKGVSTDNIRWLARILGCDDPTATRDWQMELIAAQSRLAAKRRNLRIKRGTTEVLRIQSLEENSTERDEPVSSPNFRRQSEDKKSKQSFNLARKMEALFTQKSPLDLPILIFAGAVVLGFSAYILDIHSIYYGDSERPIKQVGLIWAPNWTALFLVFLPIYLAMVTELLTFWKSDGRPKLLALDESTIDHDDGWARIIETSSISNWAVLTVCLFVVFLFQWVDMCLFPLLTGEAGNFAMDWGRIAIVQPEKISVPEAIVFSGFAYLFMSVSVFLYFAGLILLTTLARDFWQLGRAGALQFGTDQRNASVQVGIRIKFGVFRCTILGLLVTICLKLQSSFLQSEGRDILSWLLNDLKSVSGANLSVDKGKEYNIPTHFSSLLTVLATCAVFLFSVLRIREIIVQWSLPDETHIKDKTLQENDHPAQVQIPWRKMTAAVVLLVASYLLIGEVAGFSILLGVGVFFSIYCLFDPGHGKERAR